MHSATKKRPTIGFVGQGFVGGSYADDFVARGYSVVRYALEDPYKQNKDAIRTCDVVFVCVPTPTTPRGFDYSIVDSAIDLVAKGAIAVIKSTLLPGTTKVIQAAHPKVTVLCSPEFLSVATAAYDAAHPFANIIGLPKKGTKHTEAAQLVHSVLPKAPFNHTCASEEAELFKYAHNVSAYMQILTMNALYDAARSIGADWEHIAPAIVGDPTMSSRYSQPVHKGGRGAGGACFIKDFAAFAKFYKNNVGKKEGMALLAAAETMNRSLLLSTKKDLGLLAQVYGPSVVRGKRLRR